MFIKHTSKAENIRVIVAGIFYAILFLAFPIDFKSQEKPAFDKPFKICRTFGKSSGKAQIIASDNNTNLIFSNEDNFLISINPETNLENWRSQAGGKINPTLISDTVTESVYYLSSFEDESQKTIYTLNSISQRTGITNWQKKLGGYANIKLFENSDGKLLYLSAGSQNILAIQKNDGNINWTINIQPRIISLDTLINDQLGILTEESILKVSNRNGKILGETKIKKNPISNSIKNRSYLLLGYPNGEFIKISTVEKVSSIIWKIKAGGGISSLIEIENETLVSSLDNFLYLYSTESGKLKWKRRVSGRINIKPLVSEKFAIVLSSTDNIASIIELGGGKVVNQINIEDGNYFSDEPFILGKFIIFPTFRGIYLFINSDLNCK